MKSSVELMAEIMPSVRAEVARCLLLRDMTQADVSRLLGVSQPAVSQYARHVRGRRRGIDYDALRAEAMTISEKMLNGLARSDVDKELYDICKRVVR